jgi:hypothetical protein
MIMVLMQRDAAESEHCNTSVGTGRNLCNEKVGDSSPRSSTIVAIGTDCSLSSPASTPVRHASLAFGACN